MPFRANAEGTSPPGRVPTGAWADWRDDFPHSVSRQGAGGGLGELVGRGNRCSDLLSGCSYILGCVAPLRRFADATAGPGRSKWGSAPPRSRRAIRRTAPDMSCRRGWATAHTVRGGDLGGDFDENSHEGVELHGERRRRCSPCRSAELPLTASTSAHQALGSRRGSPWSCRPSCGCRC